jgi:hypothetical protein
MPTSTEKRVANPTLAALRELVRTCHDFYVHAYARHDRESWSDDFVFELTGKRNVGGKEVSVKVEVRGRVSNGHTSDFEIVKRTGSDFGDYPRYTECFRPQRGFWSLHNRDVFKSAVMALPLDVEPTFFVYLDAGTNQTLIPHGLHSDHFYLHGKRQGDRKEQKWEYLLDVTCGRHNTARFGGPTHDSDGVGRSDW